jgi:hypothetical protein
VQNCKAPRDKHGEQALTVVIERIQWRLAAHDYGLAQFWTQVAERIHAVVPNAPVRPANAASWDDLLDDPMMSEVVRDEEERRQEVRETLIKAKRHLKRGNGEE